MANRNEFQSRLVGYELIHKWRKITAEPAVTKFSKAPLSVTTRERLFLNKNLKKYLLGKVSLIEVAIDDDVLKDPLLKAIPGMKELAFLQRMKFPMNEDYVMLFRSTRFPTPERIRNISCNGVIENAGQNRLEELYSNPAYIKERKRVLSSGPLATAILPQERTVPGLPVFLSVLDALGVHGEFRHPDLDQMIISVFALPLRILREDVHLFYNPPVVVNHKDKSHDLEINRFCPYWNVENNGSLSSHRVFPDSAYYRRVYGLQLYETYLNGVTLNNDTLNKLGIKVRHFLTDLYGIDMSIEPREDTIKINGKAVPGSTVYDNIDFLFGLAGGMDALGLERNKASHLPFKLQEILPT